MNTQSDILSTESGPTIISDFDANAGIPFPDINRINSDLVRPNNEFSVAIPSEEEASELPRKLSTIMAAEQSPRAKHAFELDGLRSPRDGALHFTEAVDRLQRKGSVDMGSMTRRRSSTSEPDFEKLQLAAQIGEALIEENEEIHARVTRLEKRCARLSEQLESAEAVAREATEEADRVKEDLDDSKQDNRRLAVQLNAAEANIQHLREICAQLTFESQQDRDENMSDKKAPIPADIASESASSPAEINLPHLRALDPHQFVAKNRELRVRVRELEAELNKQTEEIGELNIKLQTSDRTAEKLRRDHTDAVRKIRQSENLDNDMKELRSQLREERERQSVILDAMETENRELAVKLDRVSVTAEDVQANLVEEQRISIEHSTSSAPIISDIQRPAPPMDFPSCSSVSLMDEIMDMTNQIKDERTPYTRDPHREFFFMTCLCVKFSFSMQNQTDLVELKNEDLFERSKEEKVPFHKYAQWIEKQVFAVHRAKSQQMSPLEKELRNSVIMLENSLEDSDNPLAVAGETLCRADEADGLLSKDRSKSTISLPIRRKKKKPKRSNS
eukprot:147629_1